VIDGKTGFLVNSVEACADRMLYLLENPGESENMGEAAREHVRRHFLSTRHLVDYLQLFNQLLRS
jgi:trehalose synthase